MDLKKVERVYTSYAGVYDQIFGKVFHEGRESAIRNLNVQPNERVLEVGVGTGLALPMYPRHCRIVGIDLSEGMLAKAKERSEALRLTHVELQRMDAGAMNFPDDTFDTVVAAYVVTAVPDYRKVVNEMIRVCRPGGRIVMLNHFRNGNKLIAAVEKVISPLTKHLGWRTDLSLSTVLEGTTLHVARKQQVNPLRFWALVECVNAKNGYVVLNGAAASYANGNGAAGYAHGNAGGHYASEHSV
ncbi:class I SAM-dependent methyltransferase [Nitrospira moscoviensis]|uniref:Phosphatidylethanolamine N-methyltransferase n=1 Tax=Nitrospira moscoviensis TaxID=42253 RepID=A0A0K2G7A6_NITMO|nr:methyltransferase domain-containing protein [Nitrospira moscoviensis]ALA56861.1 Phosphatidylethanolamine N-methyltransferase [Nitrospira moscoviensis]